MCESSYLMLLYFEYKKRRGANNRKTVRKHSHISSEKSDAETVVN